MVEFTLQKGSAEGPRAGAIKTPHGDVLTPCFMPVGTSATVKGMAPWDLHEVGASMILANTYHLLLRPGVDLIRRMGGLHRFMGWSGPILSDSGGYQVVSLGGMVSVNDDGVSFSSHIDGTRMELTPESVIEAQAALCVDIAMCLDEPIKLPADTDKIAKAATRTAAWAARSISAREKIAPQMALFGIIQGGSDLELRSKNASEITSMGFDGYAIGGLSVGEDNETLHKVAAYTALILPADKPRYLMGVGTPSDLLRAIGRGMDLFDCVLPTRNARNGWIYTFDGPLRIKHAVFKEDFRPPVEGCECRTCAIFSRAYLRHLHMAGEMLAGMLITRHNIHFYIKLMRVAREAILAGRYEEFAEPLLERMRDTSVSDDAEES